MRYNATSAFSILNIKNLSSVPILSFKNNLFCKSSLNYIGKMEIQELSETIHSNIIKEGKAEIIEPPGSKVFYNPVQEFNRDLSTLVLQKFSEQYLLNQVKSETKKQFRILEALSATGLRSIRYAKEIPNVTQVIANDISANAVQNMEINIKHNQVEDIVKTCHSNASVLMINSTSPSERFQAVDLDPYGSPAQFLDSAVQCVEDGGMLLVTCTDMAILCGNFPETCYSKYGALSLRFPAIHEMAIRIVLQNIQSHAARYKRYIVPVLSISADFYIRVFVKIFTSADMCRHGTSKLSMVYKCTGCDSFTLQPLTVSKLSKNGKNYQHLLPPVPMVETRCTHCGGKHHVGGPIWNAPIHDYNFVCELLKSAEINEFATSKRLIGVLSLVKEELIDIPLYYVASNLLSTLKMTPIPMMTIRSAILNAGYRVSLSHARKESIKTDAPASFIWDLFKVWAKEKSCEPKSIVPGSPTENIFKKQVQHKIDFSLRPDAVPLSKEQKLTRFQVNPLPNWGPGTKATTMNLLENPKKLRNQNKKKLARKATTNSDDTSKKSNLNSDENST